MTKQKAIDVLENLQAQMDYSEYDALEMAIEVLKAKEDEVVPISVIKELREDLRIAQKGIIDKKVLIGFNMAVALCNKRIGKEQ